MKEHTTTRRAPGRNEPCWCGSGRKYKKCHASADAPGPRAAPAGGLDLRVGDRVRPGRVSPPRPLPATIVRPPYIANDGEPLQARVPARPRTPDEIARMRRAGRAAREVLVGLGDHVRPGITTDELDRIAHEHAIRLGAYPSPLGYHGYPKSICTSVNEIICHGIPDDRPLADGDIMNVDVTLYLDGVHGDTSMMFCVGEVSPDRRRLIAVTERALLAGIGAARAGNQVRDIGKAIQQVAEADGLGVVRAFVGHGVGPEFHSEPTVYHYYEPDARARLEPGMTFTVEPMLNLGTWRHTMWDDNWTAVTADLAPSAQFEHTILVREDGVELLTVVEGAEQPFLAG
ncbi:type I methionyl aminopeptidase [soil metagenome]